MNIILSLMKFPTNCPSCDTTLNVSEFCCPSCSTKVSGQFVLPVLAQLSKEDQEFALQFILFSGSLKDMANKMGVSYPTVRNRLDDLIEKLK